MYAWCPDTPARNYQSAGHFLKERDNIVPFVKRMTFLFYARVIPFSCQVLLGVSANLIIFFLFIYLFIFYFKFFYSFPKMVMKGYFRFPKLKYSSFTIGYIGILCRFHPSFLHWFCSVKAMHTYSHSLKEIPFYFIGNIKFPYDR